MATVKAPNGAVMDLPDAVASGLVHGADEGWQYVEEEPKPTARKRSE